MALHSETGMCSYSFGGWQQAKANVETKGKYAMYQHKPRNNYG
jgi:hypothetical protein